MADEMGMRGKASPDVMTTLQQTMMNDVQMVSTNRYGVRPTMSYVSAEAKAKAKDPGFGK